MERHDGVLTPVGGRAVLLVAYDGTIYIGNVDTNQFFALHPMAVANWSSKGIYNPTMPAIGADGTIYVGGQLRLHIRAFRPDGTYCGNTPPALSSCLAQTCCMSEPTGQSTLATVWDGKLSALKPDGTLRWVHDLGDRTYTVSGGQPSKAPFTLLPTTRGFLPSARWYRRNGSL